MSISSNPTTVRKFLLSLSSCNYQYVNTSSQGCCRHRLMVAHKYHHTVTRDVNNVAFQGSLSSSSLLSTAAGVTAIRTTLTHTRSKERPCFHSQTHFCRYYYHPPLNKRITHTYLPQAPVLLLPPSFHHKCYLGKRPFSSSYDKDICPFHTLSISKDNSTYKEAKRSFLKIAMANHPDTIGQRIEVDGDSNDGKNKEKYDAILAESVEIFRKAKVAFEMLAEGDDGRCILRAVKEAEEEMTMNDEQFDAWFLNETGHSSPYQFDLDPQTMREVAEAAETMGGGAERDGGMWGLARMIGDRVKDGKDRGTNTLRLEAGEINGDDSANLEGTLRRRRRIRASSSRRRG